MWVYSCRGDRRGVILVCAGLFSILRGFLFKVEFGIHVSINVEPNTYATQPLLAYNSEKIRISSDVNIQTKFLDIRNFSPDPVEIMTAV